MTMKHTPGPWAYDNDTHHIVSTVSFEDMGDSEKQPQRIICTYGAMGDNNVNNLSLMVASPMMYQALLQWKCPSCGGTGTYKHKGFNNRGVFNSTIVPCKKCDGYGLHPIAKQAIRLADHKPPLINT